MNVPAALEPRLERYAQYGVLVVLAMCAATSAIAEDLVRAVPDVALKKRGGVFHAVRQPDGGVIIAGDFTSIDGASRRNLARLQPDGTLDPAWRADVEGPIYSLAVNPAGDVFVSGDFAVIDGYPRAALAKISGGGSGEIDPEWRPALDFWPIGALAAGNAGELFVSGGCSGMLEPYQPCFLVKVEDAGAGRVDPDWNPRPSDYVGSMVADGRGSLFVGGAFSSIGGLRRNGVAKLEIAGTGAADPAWDLAAGPAQVHAVHDDAVYVSFESNVGEGWRTALLRAATQGVGEVDPGWKPPVVEGRVVELHVGSDDFVYVVGAARLAGSRFRGVAQRFALTSGARDVQWNPDPDSSVSEIWVDGAARMHLGGSFSRLGGEQRLGMSELLADGRAGRALDAERGASVLTMAAQPDGGIIVVGDFETADGLPRQHMLRVGPGGFVDPQWNPEPNGAVMALALDPSGAVYVGGDFTRIGGADRARIAKLTAGGFGEAVTDWNPGTDGAVRTLAYGNGVLYAAGDFEFIGGSFQPVIGLARILPTGDVDLLWTPEPSHRVSALLPHAGSIYVAGGFTYIGGQPRRGLAKLDGAGIGSADLLWDPNAGDDTFSGRTRVSTLALANDGSLFTAGMLIHNALAGFVEKVEPVGTGAPVAGFGPVTFPVTSIVRSLAIDIDGALFVAGNFHAVGGVPRTNLAKLDPVSGALDAGWAPQLAGWQRDSSPSVPKLVMAPDGTLLVAGTFGTVDGIGRDGLVGLGTQGERLFRDGMESF